MKSKVTLKTVAKEAGVSVGTVSGILNGNPAFSKDKTKRIWEVANKLNYTPSQAAQNLRRQSSSLVRNKTNIIMHISHKPLYSENNDELNNFEVNRSYSMCRIARKHNYYVIPYWYDSTETFACPPLINGLVDGAIIGTPHIDVINGLRNRVPVVLMDVPFSMNVANISMVNFDNCYGMFLLLNFLKECCHQNIAVFNICGEVGYHHSRYYKLIEANSTIGLNINQNLSEKIFISPENHCQVIEDYAKRIASAVSENKITAIMCLDDVYARDLIKELNTLGIKVPEDVSITGFEHGAYFKSQIASIKYDWEQMIRKAIYLLHECIKNPKHDSEETLIKSEIFKGKTVRRLK